MALEVLAKNLPMHINLGDFSDGRSHIGWAKVIYDTETAKSRIEINLDERSSAVLGDMVKAFDLKAVGFAGYKKTRIPEKKES